MINPSNYNNYGYFHKLSESKIINNILDNCELFLELKLLPIEIKNNKLSDINPINGLINHELNHALEIYKYELNNKDYNYSWELSKKYINHIKYSNTKKYWDDFIYLIYIGLKHEMNSRISQIYEDIKNYDNPKVDILNNSIYLSSKYMINFNYLSFLKKMKSYYTNDEILDIFKYFCEDFEYNYTKDINYFDNVIKKIILSINKKGEKMVKRINDIVKSFELKENISVKTIPHFEKIKDYNKYEKDTKI
jgi:hypothetical protein